MRHRVKMSLLYLSLLLPCAVVWSATSETRNLREKCDRLLSEADVAQAGFGAVREVTDLRNSLLCLENDLICERLRSLPADAAQWHMSLIVQPDWKASRSQKLAVEALDREPHLASIKAQTKFHLLTTDNAIYLRDFSKECPLTPCLLITRADGAVIYKESGAQLGIQPRKLYCAVAAEIRRHCPDGRCLPPLRFPDAKPDEEPVHEPIPDTRPGESTADDDLLPMAACFLVAFGAVIFFVIKKDLS